jgi:hypothetical protein
MTSTSNFDSGIPKPGIVSGSGHREEPFVVAAANPLTSPEFVETERALFPEALRLKMDEASAALELATAQRLCLPELRKARLGAIRHTIAGAAFFL